MNNLLVDGNIIALDLNLENVYNKVWAKNHPEEPMLVIFRLQGLDGEATEPMINSFPTALVKDVEPQIKYAYTKILAEGNLFTQ